MFRMTLSSIRVPYLDVTVALGEMERKPTLLDHTLFHRPLPPVPFTASSTTFATLADNDAGVVYWKKQAVDSQTAEKMNSRPVVCNAPGRPYSDARARSLVLLRLRSRTSFGFEWLATEVVVVLWAICQSDRPINTFNHFYRDDSVPLKLASILPVFTNSKWLLP